MLALQMYVKKWLFLFPATNNRCTNNTTSSVAVHPQKFKGNINFVFLLNRSGGPIHPLHVSDATLFSLLHSLLLCWICESKLEQVYQRVPFVINKWVTHRPTTANKSTKQKPLDFLVFQFLLFLQSESFSKSFRVSPSCWVDQPASVFYFKCSFK